MGNVTRLFFNSLFYSIVALNIYVLQNYTFRALNRKLCVILLSKKAGFDRFFLSKNLKHEKNFQAIVAITT